MTAWRLRVLEDGSAWTEPMEPHELEELRAIPRVPPAAGPSVDELLLRIEELERKLEGQQSEPTEGSSA